MMTTEDKERLNAWAMSCEFESIEDMCYWSGDHLEKSTVKDLICIRVNTFASFNRNCFNSVIEANKKTDMKYIKIVGSERLVEILKDKGFEAKTSSGIVTVTVNKQHETNTTI